MEGGAWTLVSAEQLEALGGQPTLGEPGVVNGTSVHRDCPECDHPEVQD